MAERPRPDMDKVRDALREHDERIEEPEPQETPEIEGEDEDEDGDT